MSFSSLDSSLTGPLFVTDRMRDVFSDQSKIAAIIACEAALARAEAEFGLAPEGLAAAIESIEPSVLTLDEIGLRTEIAGVPSIPILKLMQQRLPVNLEAAFHRGATTQDIIDTALILQMKQALALLAEDIAAILKGLSVLAERHRTVPCVGRTYGQHAAPITFGFKIAVWLSGICDAAAQFQKTRANVLTASLGGPVGTLTALGGDGPSVQKRFAALLGLSDSAISWHADRGRVAEAAFAIARLTGALAKMAHDIVHLMSTEAAEVFEPLMKGRGGSSAMPHKRNPVGSTVIIAAHQAAKGFVLPLLDAMVVSHERSAGAWHGEWNALPQMFGLASGALREARWLAEGLEIDADRMRLNIDLTRGLLFADAAASRLAPLLGRDRAHETVESAAAAVRDSGRSLQSCLEEMPELASSECRQAIVATFDLEPSTLAGSIWTSRAIEHAKPVIQSLETHMV